MFGYIFGNNLGSVSCLFSLLKSSFAKQYSMLVCEFGSHRETTKNALNIGFLIPPHVYAYVPFLKLNLVR